MGHDGTEGLKAPELPWPVRGGQTAMFLMAVVTMAPTTLRRFSLVNPCRPTTDDPTLHHIAYVVLTLCAFEGVARTLAVAAFAPSLLGAAGRAPDPRVGRRPGTSTRPCGGCRW